MTSALVKSGHGAHTQKYYRACACPCLYADMELINFGPSGQEICVYFFFIKTYLVGQCGSTFDNVLYSQEVTDGWALSTYNVSARN